MGMFDFLNKGIGFKKPELNGVLSQEEYKSKFFYGEEYIKREYYSEYLTQRLEEEFGMNYNEKAKRWCSEWNNNQRFVVELYRRKGTHIFLNWGYNYDFIPDINSKNKLVWHRTRSSVKIHLTDSWYNHIAYTSDKESGFSEQEFYNPIQCPVYQYEIPTYTSDMDFALEYIKSVIDKNIPFMREWENNVKTVGDAINIFNQRIIDASSLCIPYMCHIRAFLYAKNKDIDKAIQSMKQGYGTSEIPQIILDELNYIAGE